MWPLAWILGFEETPGIGGMIDGDTIAGIIQDFLGGTDHGPDELVGSGENVDLMNVAAAEHLFYCAHNAARSATFSGVPDAVPEGFHPVVDGGVVHERRHALTWAMSPDDSWDDTDLST